MRQFEERRKETRIDLDGNSFLELLAPAAGSLKCPVLNLSRLGVAFECDLPLELGSSFECKLHFRGHCLDIRAIVRVAESGFVGAEFADLTDQNFKLMKSLLSTSYIAHSIQIVSPQCLADHVIGLYRGLDFECIVFKPGLSGIASQMQIMWKGKVVEIMDGRARFVPAMLMREAGEEHGVALLKYFSGVKDSGNAKELHSFFKGMNDVLKHWDQCPLNLHSVVRSQLGLAS